MKRISIQPTGQTIVRKVITNTVQQSSPQINVMKKVNNLTQSGTVSLQPKIIRQKILAPAPTTTGSTSYSANSNLVLNNQQQNVKCFICDEHTMSHLTRNLSEAKTLTSLSELPNKIASVVGESFMVIVGVDDVICRRCYGLFNQMDKIESELERVKNTIKNFINKKYNINDDEGQPPAKIQKLNSGVPAYTARMQNNQDDSGTISTPTSSPQTTITRKVIVSGRGDTIESSPTSNISINNSSPSQQQSQQTPPQRRQPIKLYKCVSCDFKTTDLNAFQPHYEVCKGHQNKTTSSQNVKCLKCNKVYLNNVLLNKHIQEAHSDADKVATNTTKVTEKSGSVTVYACNQCAYKTQDKANFDSHQNKHIKMKPFKCRLCLQRFETRDQATHHAKQHAPSYFRCPVCELAFNKRSLLEEHQRIHDIKEEKKVQKVVTTNTQQSTQKLLQESIDEALRGDEMDAKNIQFFTCNLCSVTFLNELMYSQHMKTHGTTSTTITPKVEPVAKRATTIYRKEKPVQVQTTQNTLSDGDLESIFEKLHSDSSHVAQNNGTTSDGNVMITTQESGGITYNIRIPQDPPQESDEQKSQSIDMPTLDQPEEDSQEKSDSAEQQMAPVSMPSLDEDDNTQSSQDQEQTATLTVENPDGTVTTQTIPMNLDELQNAAEEGQQIKFILDNGQYLQLDNHILTTDAEGNQILVQGTDSEHLQQLLQSVGVVMQGNGEGIVGEGEHTLQMINENNQMILVQSEDGGETRLIDASMLSAEGGNIVIQQGADGETHLTTADGIPVSVAFTDQHQEGIVASGAEGITVAVAGEGGEEQQFVLQQPLQLAEGQEGQVSEDSQTATDQETQSESQQQQSGGEESQQEERAEDSQEGVQSTVPSGEVSSTTETNESSQDKVDDKTDEKKEEVSSSANDDKADSSEAKATATEGTTTGENFFSLGEIMQPKSDSKDNK